MLTIKIEINAERSTKKYSLFSVSLVPLIPSGWSQPFLCYHYLNTVPSKDRIERKEIIKKKDSILIRVHFFSLVILIIFPLFPYPKYIICAFVYSLSWTRASSDEKTKCVFLSSVLPTHLRFCSFRSHSLYRAHTFKHTHTLTVHFCLMMCASFSPFLLLFRRRLD